MTVATRRAKTPKVSSDKRGEKLLDKKTGIQEGVEGGSALGVPGHLNILARGLLPLLSPPTLPPETPPRPPPPPSRTHRRNGQAEADGPPLGPQKHLLPHHPRPADHILQRHKHVREARRGATPARRV